MNSKVHEKADDDVCYSWLQKQPRKCNKNSKLSSSSAFKKSHVDLVNMATNFLQKVFNTISLQKDEKLWLSTDDSLTEARLRLLAKFPETQFAAQLKLDCVSNAKNGKLSSALREKGNLCYAQGDCESALRLYNQVFCRFF